MSARAAPSRRRHYRGFSARKAADAAKRRSAESRASSRHRMIVCPRARWLRMRSEGCARLRGSVRCASCHVQSVPGSPPVRTVCNQFQVCSTVPMPAPEVARRDCAVLGSPFASAAPARATTPGGYQHERTDARANSLRSSPPATPRDERRQGAVCSFLPPSRGTLRQLCPSCFGNPVATPSGSPSGTIALRPRSVNAASAGKYRACWW